MAGIMRPGQANQRAGGNPLVKEFYQNVTQRLWDTGIAITIIMFSVVCTIHQIVTAIRVSGMEQVVIIAHGLEWKVCLLVMKLECSLI